MEHTQAAASVADPFNGEQTTLAEFQKFRETGEVPERFKPQPADSATADAQEQNGSEAGEAESADATEASTENNQEQPRKPRNAAQRIAQLEAAIEEEWGKDEPDVVRIGQLNATIDKINGRPKRKSEVAPPQPAAQTRQATPQQYTNLPKPKADDFQDWDSYNEALIDWKAEEKIAKYRYEQGQIEQMRHLQATVAAGESLYGKDFGPIAEQTAGVIGQDPEIPQLIKQRFGSSDVLPHLTYVLGEDADALDEFVKLAKTNPFKALDRITLLESGIREELAKPKTEQQSRGEDGKFTKTAPEKRQTSAPKPVSPVGGGSSKRFDVSDDSLSNEEWMRQRNKQLGIG